MADAKIFINYRRDDSRADSGRLYDRLSARFPGRVFRDVASLEPGVEWHEAIARVIGQADACIVVIGKNWATISDNSGRRRLDDPRDTVRQELAAALERKMRVFPVLVGGARMPEEEELPADLQAVCRRNALEITEQDWDEGFNKLVKALETALQVRSTTQDGRQLTSRKPLMMIAVGAVAALLVLGFYVATLNQSSPDNGTSTFSNEPSAPAATTTTPASTTSSTPAAATPAAVVGGPSQKPESDESAQRARLIGTWRANVVELGEPVEIIWHIVPDGTSNYTFTSGNRRGTATTKWTYSDGVIYERSEDGPPSSGAIRWIDANNFVLTIIDNGNPRTRGLERRYTKL
jgi:hypothetical protein